MKPLFSIIFSFLIFASSSLSASPLVNPDTDTDSTLPLSSLAPPASLPSGGKDAQRSPVYGRRIPPKPPAPFQNWTRVASYHFVIYIEHEAVQDAVIWKELGFSFYGENIPPLDRSSTFLEGGTGNEALTFGIHGLEAKYSVKLSPTLMTAICFNTAFQEGGFHLYFQGVTLYSEEAAENFLKTLRSPHNPLGSPPPEGNAVSGGQNPFSWKPRLNLLPGVAPRR